MRKLAIVLVMLVAISGCGVFDEDMMLCTLENNQVSYEVRYKGDDVHRFTIVNSKDYASYTDVFFEDVVEETKAREKELNKVDGLDMSYEQDDKVITTRLDVDYDVYDLRKDKNAILDFPLMREDMRSIEVIREVIIKNGYRCDEIVETK